MGNKYENLTIGTFAKAAGVGVETIRFYQRKGLLTEPHKPYGGIRRYNEMDIARVKFVKSAQQLGFTLDEVLDLLMLDDGTHCTEARLLAENKLKNVREKLENLHQIERVLARLVDDCCAHQGIISCPIIVLLYGNTSDLT